jgi:DNA-directed RNA polymerase specialized sigma24 family protein
LAGVRPEKGRFRSFLLICLKHFLADARDRAQAQKCGGGRHVISLDDSNAEARYQLENQEELSPDRIFDRRWAYALLETVMKRLQEEFLAAGKGAVFDTLRPFLAGEGRGLSYSEVAGRLALTEAAAKMTKMQELLKSGYSWTVSP